MRDPDRKPNPRPTAKWSALWIMGVIYASLLPFDFRTLPSPSNAFGLSSLRPAATTPEDVRTNLLVYVPIGLLVGLWVRSCGAAKFMTLFLCVSIGTVLSVALECLQTCLSSRVGSWTDVLLNASGAMFGAIAVISLGGFVRSALTQVRREFHDRPMRVTASMLTIALFLYGLFPFDFITSTEQLHASFARARWGLVGPSVTPADGSFVAPLAQVSGALWFTALGYLLALGGLEAKRHPLVVLGSAMKNGTLLAALTEGLQLFTGSHVFDLGTIFLRIMGVVLGAWSAVFLIEPGKPSAGPWKARVLAPTPVLTLIALIQVGLLMLPVIPASGGAIRPEASRFVLGIPFDHLWRLPAPAAASDILTTLATYGVLAWTLAVLLRRGGVRATLVPVSIAVVVIALGQIVLGAALLGKTPDPATPVLALLATVVAVRFDRTSRAIHA